MESNLKFLGVTVDQELNWKEHVVGIRKRCLASLAQLKRIFPSLPIKTRIMLYNALVLPHLDYCSCIWNSCGVDGRNKIERVQNYAMRLIMSAEPRTPSAELRSKLSWMTLQNRRNMQVISKVHRCLQNKAPHYLCSKLKQTSMPSTGEQGGRQMCSFNDLELIFIEIHLNLMELISGTAYLLTLSLSPHIQLLEKLCTSTYFNLAI